MKKRCAVLISMAVISSSMVFVSKDAPAADLGIGGRVWYVWWAPYWSKVSDTRVLPRINMGSDFSGGPLLNFSINEIWGLSASYAYGVYRGRVTSLMLNPLYYYIEQPVTTKREVKRHDANLLVTGRAHRYVRLLGGVSYSGYSMNTRATVAVLSYSLRIFHHLAGPVIGAECIIPLVSTLYLLPGVAGVFQFSRFVDYSGNRISAFINSRVGGADTTLLYAGLNLTLSLAYCINRINVTLALGGTFRYLWITDIGNNNFVAHKRHDMFGGLSLTAVYTFNFTDTAENKSGDPAPLPQLL
jgi:hypothetical protein